MNVRGQGIVGYNKKMKDIMTNLNNINQERWEWYFYREDYPEGFNT